MSTVSHGADVDALRATATAMKADAEVITTTSVRISVRSYALDWNGPDARRFRAEWEDVHAPALQVCARSLVDAALRLVGEAEEQEAASGAGPGAIAPATTPGPTTPGSPPGGSLGDQLRTLRDALLQMPGAAQIGQVLAANPRAARDLVALDATWDLISDSGSGLARHGGAALGAVGLYLNLQGLHEAYHAGDANGVFQNGLPIVTAGAVAAGAIGAGTAAAITVPAAVGGLIGESINDAMEGTTYGDRVTANFERVFDTFGAAGMVFTPLVLAASGLDLLGTHGEEPPIP